MNSRIKLLFIILVFSIGSVYGQKVQIGFGLESNGIKSSHGQELEPYTGSILGFNLKASVFPIDDRLAIEARVGAIGGVNFYSGQEISLLAKYFILKPAYILGGIVWHKTESDGHFGYHVYGSHLRMPAFGIGVNPIGALNFEVLYLNTGDLEAGQYYEKLNEAGVPVNLKYALKIGIGLNFNLFRWN